MKILTAIASGLILGAALSNPLHAMTPEEQAEALKKAQDPLADVRALMTDNTVAFGTADDKTSYGFQLQPVYSIPTDMSFNFITRAVIPVLGVQEGAEFPKLGSDPIGGSGLTWGISDIYLQGYFVPKSDSSIKFGFGPQVSLRTRTDPAVGGAGWGGGLAGVVFGLAGNFSFGGIVAHHWGQDNYNLTTVQPIVNYSLESISGAYFGYNNSITYNWSAPERDAWQIPLGLTMGKTLLFEKGDMLDLSVGGYNLVASPRGGADWQLKFGISYFLK